MSENKNSTETGAGNNPIPTTIGDESVTKAPAFEVGQRLFILHAIGRIEEATLIGVEKATNGIRKFYPNFNIGDDVYVVRYVDELGDGDRIYGSHPSDRIFRTVREADEVLKRDSVTLRAEAETKKEIDPRAHFAGHQHSLYWDDAKASVKATSQSYQPYVEARRSRRFATFLTSQRRPRGMCPQ